jgi:hypothetical protein
MITEFGGIDAGNGAEQAFETQVGGHFHVGAILLSVDVIGGYMNDAIIVHPLTTAIGPGCVKMRMSATTFAGESWRGIDGGLCARS